MQLYVADYLGDTRHLTTEQHGAYLLILMAMWRADGVLPDDDAKLARIAGLTVARWRKIRDDVLAFFDPCEGGITQARLAAELTIAEEKSEKRSQAGRAGGRAKALKYKKATVANAMRSSKHSPEPEPEEPHKPLSLAPLARLLELSSAGSFASVAESIFLAQPIVGGKRRSTRPDVAAAFEAAIKRGGRPVDIARAVRAYYALPDCQRDGGQFASGAKVVMAKDRWRDYLAPAAEPENVRPTPEVLAHRRAHYAKTGEWRADWGPPPPPPPANDERGRAA